MSYDDTNRGRLFKNNRKQGIASNPDYTGELDVGGEKFWLNAWIKTSKVGQKYMSLSIKPKTDAVVRQSQQHHEIFDPLN
jgi:hypothetical protein